MCALVGLSVLIMWVLLALFDAEKDDGGDDDDDDDDDN